MYLPISSPGSIPGYLYLLKPIIILYIPNMTKEERHKLIIETLMRHESIPVSSLSMLLDVSAVTNSKDLT